MCKKRNGNKLEITPCKGICQKNGGKCPDSNLGKKIKNIKEDSILGKSLNNGVNLLKDFEEGKDIIISETEEDIYGLLSI